nr:tryptase alpha/beta-1-like [Leptinotarsa decemlineata]
MSPTWSIVLLVSLFSSSVHEQRNLSALVENVFGKPPTNNNQQESTVGPAIDLQPNFGNNTNGARIANCTCVRYYLCENGTIIRNGKGIIDIRSNINPCSNVLETCCSLENIRLEPTVPPRPNVKSPTGCGYRNSEGIDFRITGDTDNEAQFGEFPWMVAILREKTHVYQCGGSLIHPKVVLTAAHCVSDRNKSFKVRAGEWDSQHKAEPYPYQDRLVKSVTIHPEYYSGALYNDVALLTLESPVEMMEHIGTACLPLQDDVVQSGRCFATGWGKDIFGKKGKYQVILKKIDLPIVPSPQCQDKLRTTRLGRFFNLHSTFICAGGELNKDTCKGDGGSPLVCPIPGSRDRYFQAGIVAWGIGCGEDQIPGVYGNVAKFRNWIDEQMDLAGLDSSSYQY